MENNSMGQWPQNFLGRLFRPEELEVLSEDPPAELEALLVYTIRDAYSDWEAEVILKHFKDGMPASAIATQLRLANSYVDKVLLNAGEKLRDTLLLETYQKGLTWRIRLEQRAAYAAGYTRGYAHAYRPPLKEVKNESDSLQELLFDLPGHDHPIASLHAPAELHHTLYDSGIRTVKELLDADDQKLMQECLLNQTEINELESILRKNGYSCPLTRSRNQFNYSFWPVNLMIPGLSENAAMSILGYAAVDMKETFEFIRILTLTREEEYLLSLDLEGGYSIDEIAEELQISKEKVHCRSMEAMRKLRSPILMCLARKGLKNFIREMMKTESECGFQTGFARGEEDRWSEMDYQSGRMVPPEEILININNTSIDELQLGTRIEDTLRQNGVQTISDLMRMSNIDLLSMNSIGSVAVSKITEKLNAFLCAIRIDMISQEAKSFFCENQ